MALGSRDEKMGNLEKAGDSADESRTNEVGDRQRQETPNWASPPPPLGHHRPHPTMRQQLVTPLVFQMRICSS